MIRITTVIAAFAAVFVAAACVPARAAVAHPLVLASLLHFDTPGHQMAEMVPVRYHRYYRHHRRYRHLR